MESIKDRKIVIVDDESIGVKILIKSLAKFDLQLEYYNSGESFFASLENTKPDLLLLDVMMPEISGIEILEKMREKYSSVELPIIMLSARDENADIVEALKLGANDYITKPADPDVAAARIKTQLNLKKYYEDSLKKIELETLNTMIVTYNHEINNPLSIAIGNLENDISEMNNKKLTKAKEALNRITQIVKSIQSMISKGPQYTDYNEKSKMLKLK